MFPIEYYISKIFFVQLHTPVHVNLDTCSEKDSVLMYGCVRMQMCETWEDKKSHGIWEGPSS